jgi:phospholipid/cholesterol/gamma-HCH transport system substrate-binding protein
MPRTRSLAWSELKLGILAILAVALAAFFIFLVGGEGGLPWQRYSLKTRFPNVMGLKHGAVVRIAGVEVGQVTDMTFVGAQVEVTFEVSKDMQDKITTASRAMLGSVSLLGESAVDLTAGSTGTPLPEWSYVPSQRTPGQLADVAEGATLGIDEVTQLLKDIRRGKGTLGRLVTDDSLFKEFTALLTAAEQVASGINKGRGTLGKLANDPAAYASLRASLENLESITKRINAGEGSLGRLLKDEQLARSATATAANVEQITGRLAKGEGTAGKILNDTALYNRLDAISERIDTLVKRLNDGEGSAGLLLRDKQLYENMNGAVSDLRTLIADIRKDPKKYLNVKVSIF